MALLFFLLITSSVMPSWWMYYAEQKLGWQGPTDLEAFLRDPFSTSAPFFSAEGFLWLSYEAHLMLRDAIAMGLTTGPIISVLVDLGPAAELAAQAARRVRQRPTHRWVPVGGQRRQMPFTKTEVDIHEDYTLEAVDPAWLAQGVKSPKHLMLDPDNCILCRACEDVCPWNCIFMLSTGHRRGLRDAGLGGRGAHLVRDLRRGRQRVHAVLRLRGPVPHGHAVLCAAAGGFRRQKDDGRGPDVPGGGGVIVPTARGGTR